MTEVRFEEDVSSQAVTQSSSHDHFLQFIKKLGFAHDDASATRFLSIVGVVGIILAIGIFVIAIKSGKHDLSTQQQSQLKALEAAQNNSPH